MTSNPYTSALIALLALIILCATVLVALDKIIGADYLQLVVVPIITGIVGAVAGAKGFQSGSEATASPPPSA